MDSISCINHAMAYIEEHLREEFDNSEISRIAFCSEYHFRRMFSFLSGISLSEYFQGRRLTLAALDLKNKSLRIIDVAVKFDFRSIYKNMNLQYSKIVKNRLVFKNEI